MKPPAGLRLDFAARRLPVASMSSVRANARAVAAAHRGPLLRVLTWHCAAALTGLVAPWAIGQIVDQVTRGRDQARLGQLMAVLIVGLLVQSVLTWFANRGAFVLAETIFAKIREDFLTSVVRLPLSVVERAGTGDLVARTTGDVDALAYVVRDGIPSLLVAAATVTMITAAAIWVAPVAALAFVIAPLLLWLPLRLYLLRAWSAYQWERACYSGVDGVSAETVHGLATVDALASSGIRRAAMTRALTETSDAELWGLRIRVRLFPWVDIAFGALVAATALWSGWLTTTTGLTVGLAVTVTLYAQRLVDPIGDLVGWADEIQVAATAYSRLLGVAQVPPDREAAASLPSGPAIEVDEVHFAYREGHDVLCGLSLALIPGERLAIVGPSGAGKTTLGRLMAGIDRPASGEVTVGGVRLVDLDLPTLRGEVALVTQEHHVFVGTIADNLRLPRPRAGEDQLWSALRTVDADAWVSTLPEGLDTVVGSGGLALTEAQAQQLALARLVLADPHTLILDEATSLLDPRAARHLERSLAAVMAGRTVAAIAHRLQTAHDADRVCVVEEGQISELGSHHDLLASGGAYADLWASWHGGIEQGPRTAKQ